jgi:PadR family transcriptional regulator, regulatory protein PadR
MSVDGAQSSGRKNRLTKPAMSHTLCVTQYVTHGMSPLDEIFENLRLELRRGSLTLAVMVELRTERYGYVLRKALAEQGMEIDENTLYPLLRRLESQGLLASEWREEANRKKRFYRLSKEGQSILERLIEEWRSINASLELVLGTGARLRRKG